MSACTNMPIADAVGNEAIGLSTVVGHLLAAGQIGLNPLTDYNTLKNVVSDPYLQRVGWFIDKAGTAYGTASAKPLGYYAFIALHNVKIDANWDGGNAANPYGNPCDTPRRTVNRHQIGEDSMTNNACA